MGEERKRIKVQVVDKVAKLADDTQFIVGGNDDYDIEFLFDNQWDEHPTKTVLFVYGDRVSERLMNGNVCEGIAIDGANVVGIGVFSGDIRTTTPAFLNCKQSIRDLAKYKSPATPGEDVYNQIIELLNKYTTEINEIVREAVDEYLEENPPVVDNSLIVSNEKRITNIECSIDEATSSIDDSVAYNKAVPARACIYAKLASFGGMSHKSKNLLKRPYFETSMVREGITFTVNDDGIVTANGTATGHAYLALEKFNVPAGTYYLSGCPDTGTDAVLYFANASYSIYKIDRGNGVLIDVPKEETMDIVISIPSGTILNNAVFKPMLNEGSTALPYELWYEGTRDSKVTEIKNHGANLYNGEQNLELPASAGKVIFEGEINEPVVFSYVADGTYTNMGGCFFEFVEANGTVVQPSAYGNPQKLNSLKKILIRNWCGFTGKVSNIMLNYGDTASPYKPHREPISYPIPAEIQAINGYGKDGFVIDLEKQTSAYEGSVSPLPVRLEPIIEVEGGGRLEFVNEYKNAVPSTVKYRNKLETKSEGTEYIFSRSGDYLILEATDGTSIQGVLDDPHINISANSLPSSIANTTNNGVYINFVRAGELLSSRFVKGEKGIKVTCQNNSMIISQESEGGGGAEMTFLPMGNPARCVDETFYIDDFPSKFSYYSDGTDGSMISADTGRGLVLFSPSNATVSLFQNVNEDYYTVIKNYSSISIYAYDSYMWNNNLATPPTIIIEGTKTKNVGGKLKINLVIYTSDRNPYQAE